MSHSPEPANPLGSSGWLRYCYDFYRGESAMNTKKPQARPGAYLAKRYATWVYIGCTHSGNGFETASRREPETAVTGPTTT
jgi:hypothetical protein